MEKRSNSSSSADTSSTSKRSRTGDVSGVMGAIGNYEKRKSARDHATKLLNTMVKTTSHASNPPDVFDKLTGDQLCNRSVFERFAGWLTVEESGYKFRDGFEKDGTTPQFSLAIHGSVEDTKLSTNKQHTLSHGEHVRELHAGPHTHAQHEIKIRHVRNS